MIDISPIEKRTVRCNKTYSYLLRKTETNMTFPGFK